MKHYIILTSGIFEMGGAEMFTANKCKYLKSKGWDVRVFYYRNFGELKIQELAPYRGNCIPELLYGITYITQKRRSLIIEQICAGINKGDEVVVESHIINLAYWGELVAEYCGGKSILNSMEENIAPFSDAEASFVEHKLKRWEILNAVSTKTLHRYFNDRYKEEYVQYIHNYMRVFCSNVVTDDDESLSLPTEGQSIMSIGRLDKPYILPMFEEIKKFASQNKDKKYNVLVIGGSPDGSVEHEVKNLFAGVDNVSLFMYGYVFPVPRNLINKADVGIATANSVLVTADQGIPTIAMDIHDFQPIGIFGRNTNNKFSRDNEPIIPASTWLQEVLNEGKFPKVAPTEMDVDAELERVFGKQVEFLVLSPNDHQYYDVERVYPQSAYMINQFKKLIHDIIKK